MVRHNAPQGILDEMLDSIEEDREVERLFIGAYWTAVVSRGCGLASALRDPCPRHERFPVERAGEILPCSGRELANLSRSDSLLEASIGLAAINSLLEVDLSRALDLNASRLLMDRGRGKRVAVVGNFPFLPRLREKTEELWVFERPAEEARGEIPEEKMGEFLPRADVAGISATTLINHTLDSILEMLRPDCFKVMIGPTTPLSPVLFDRGFDVLAGSVVTDVEQALACVSQGAIFRQMRGIRHIALSRQKGTDL